MTNFSYLFAITVFVIFFVIHFFVRGNYIAGILEFIFIFPMIYGFIKLRKDQNIKKNAFFANLLLFFAVLGTLFIFNFKEGVIFWALLFPFVATNLSGEKLGFLFIVVFNIIVYAAAYVYWQSDDGMPIKYIRFITVSVIISTLVCFYEKSISRGFKKQTELNEILKNSVCEIRELAITDSLTSLYNKRHFDTILSEEFNRAKRVGEPFVLAIIDVDNFKNYNDTYGHGAGDRALVKISRVLKEQTLRSGDFAFRIGGEEFAIILQSSFLEDTHVYFDNLREKIEQEKIEHIKNKPFGLITISIGVVIISDYQSQTIADAYKIADENLYRVKNSGRNAVFLSTVMDRNRMLADTIH
jgi:diguanylate cyclase (GGDEF)-like protein